MTTVQFMVRSPREAVEVMDGLLVNIIEPHVRTGRAGILTWQSESVYLREKHRGLFHGPILTAFHEGLWLDDPRTGQFRTYSREVWKEFLKRQFLTPRIQEYVTRHGEIKYRQLPLSTEALSNDEYSDFLHQCIALGHEHGVNFEEGY